MTILNLDDYGLRLDAEAIDSHSVLPRYKYTVTDDSDVFTYVHGFSDRDEAVKFIVSRMLILNKDYYEDLPNDLQRTVRYCDISPVAKYAVETMLFHTLDSILHLQMS